MGVDLLRERNRSNHVPFVKKRTSPFVATLLSAICPGLGAAYNGQTSKAIVHFAIFASFFQMAVVTQGMWFFVLGVIGTWLFSAVDACRTAQLMRAGLSPDAEDDVIARRLYGNPLAWGTTLIIIGTLFLLHTLLRVTLPIKELLPVALVALGAYMLFDYIRRSKASDRIVRFDSRRPPPSVVATTRPTDATNLRTGETTQFARRDVKPLPFERRS